MTAAEQPPRVLPEHGWLLGQETIAYVCDCPAGFRTETFRVRDEDQAAAQIRDHLTDAHGAALEVGRCEKCTTPTDHFRAHTPHGDLWLCLDHSPEMSTP